MADVNAGKDFLTSLIEREIKVAAYEVASGDKISGAVRVATIMDHAPDAVKSMLHLSPVEQRRNVDALKLWIQESRCATLGLFQGSVPMQVGAVNDGGKDKKGKNKMTGEKGKGKGKSEDKSKHKAARTRTRRSEWWSTARAILRLLLTLLEVETQTHGLSNSGGTAEEWCTGWYSGAGSRGWRCRVRATE